VGVTGKGGDALVVGRRLDEGEADLGVMIMGADMISTAVGVVGADNDDDNDNDDDGNDDDDVGVTGVDETGVGWREANAGIKTERRGLALVGCDVVCPPH
jgi:hypothetical protein